MKKKLSKNGLVLLNRYYKKIDYIFVKYRIRLNSKMVKLDLSNRELTEVPPSP